ISTPTNHDAREIGAAIRKRRQELGEIKPDAVALKAQDQNGIHYDLPVAVGDRVRLFNMARASFGQGKAGAIGFNGSVIEIRDIRKDGIVARAANGREGFVKWDALRARDTGRIRLTYGDAISLDARTGDTAKEHITVLASGSRHITAKTGYVAMSRHKRTSWLVVSDGEERREIVQRRPIGDQRPIEQEHVVNNVARNFARDPVEISATELMRAQALERAAREAEKEDKRAERWAEEPARPAPAAAHTEPRAEVIRTTEPERTSQESTPPPDSKPSADSTPSKPPERTRQRIISEADAQAEFAEALRRAGLVVKG